MRIDANAKIYVAGADTVLGRALLHQLAGQGYGNIVPGDPDFTDSQAVNAFFARHKPQYVFVAAGKSGGIAANQKYPADLMLHNLQVTTHVIQSAYQHGVQKLLYLASSCSYPKHCPQPMNVRDLLGGPLEPTNEAYAVAKIAGIKLCEAFRQQYGVMFIAGIPANYFGIGDDFSPEDSHVVGALLDRMHRAKLAKAPSVEIWGTGQAQREFLYADDLADACIFIMEHYEGREPINIGGGRNVSIAELAGLIREVVDYQGELRFDTSKPDGMPLKALDSSVLHALGWRAQTDFQQALAMQYASYMEQDRIDVR